MTMVTKPRRPEDILSDQVRTDLSQIPGVFVLLNVVTWGKRIYEGAHPELFGLGEGTPDLILCVMGRFVALELKSEKGRARAKQLEKQAQWRLNGAVVEHVRTVEAARDVVKRVIASVGEIERAKYEAITDWRKGR